MQHANARRRSLAWPPCAAGSTHGSRHTSLLKWPRSSTQLRDTPQNVCYRKRKTNLAAINVEIVHDNRALRHIRHVKLHGCHETLRIIQAEDYFVEHGGNEHPLHLVDCLHRGPHCSICNAIKLSRAHAEALQADEIMVCTFPAETHGRAHHMVNTHIQQKKNPIQPGKMVERQAIRVDGDAVSALNARRVGEWWNQRLLEKKNCRRFQR